MKRAAMAAALFVLVALVAGCGGGGTTRVIERTVTERVPVKAPRGGQGKGGSGSGSTETATVKEEAATKAAEEKEAAEPERVVHLRNFRTPSGNIGCVMYEGGARCDIRDRDWAPPARPASCSKQVDFGQGLAVSETGEATFVCAGDTALDPSSSSLAYGTASEVAGAECVSREDGVSCVNGAGHGFFISKESYQVY
jgi:hypothetical protein